MSFVVVVASRCDYDGVALPLLDGRRRRNFDGRMMVLEIRS
jgi:hypothetical protein